MRPLLFVFLAFSCLATAPARAEDEAPRPEPARVCYSAAETRDKIAASRLIEPFGVMRAQASEHKAEAIGVRLCRTPGGLVYEIDLLRRDGRLIHTSVDAATGKPVAAAGRK